MTTTVRVYDLSLENITSLVFQLNFLEVKKVKKKKLNDSLLEK